MLRIGISLTAVLLVCLTLSVLAAVPQSVNYQGRLTDSEDKPLDGSFSMTFTIYDAAVGGNSKWTEVHGSITVAEGLFSVQLGSVNPILDTVFNDDTRYLGIAVGGASEIYPRTAMITVPYAYRVATVDGAIGGTVVGKLSIGPGHTNTGNNAFVAGQNNSATGSYSTVPGGRYNEASNILATISGGGFNTANGDNTSIGGGYYNTAGGFGATVSGGQTNSAGGDYAAVGGGKDNVAGGIQATVPGGLDNDASGTRSFAAGYRAKAVHNGAFVWADNVSTDFSSTDNNQFLIRASGGVGIGTNAPTTQLDVNGSIRSRSGGIEYPDGTTQTTATISVPVGSVTAWLKSFPNTPALPNEFVECNGQTLSDPGSPFNGQTIPNLNGQTTGIHRFLRGSTSSGGTGGSLNHDHSVNIGATPIVNVPTTGFAGSAGIFTSTSESHLPQYYYVVWIMRIK